MPQGYEPAKDAHRNEGDALPLAPNNGRGQGGEQAHSPAPSSDERVKVRRDNVGV